MGPLLICLPSLTCVSMWTNFSRGDGGQIEPISQWDAIPLLLIFVGAVETIDKLLISLHWSFSILRTGVDHHDTAPFSLWFSIQSLGSYRGVRRWHSWTYLAFSHGSHWGKSQSWCLAHTLTETQTHASPVLRGRAAESVTDGSWCEGVLGHVSWFGRIFLCLTISTKRYSPKVKISI